MPVSDEYRDFVLEQLKGLGDLASRRMFGGVGIWCDGLFFAILMDNVAYLKVDESNVDDFVERGMEPFRVPFRQPRDSGRTEQVLGYYAVPADVLEDTDELERWAARSLEVARRKAR